jgi:hypothetical protein
VRAHITPPPYGNHCTHAHTHTGPAPPPPRTQDSFYRSLTPAEMVSAQNKEYNFDAPEAFDQEAMLLCVSGGCRETERGVLLQQ